MVCPAAQRVSIFPARTLDIFWGSPDQYNSITFWTGVGGTGNSFTVTGGQLDPFPGLILGLGHDFVHFLSDVQFNSIVLFSGQPAFESQT